MNKPRLSGLIGAWLVAAGTAQLPPMPSPVPQLRELLRSADPAVRLTAATALASEGTPDNGLPNVAAVPDLLRVCADDPDDGVAEAAALALDALGAWPLGAFEFVAADLDAWARTGAPAATIAHLRTSLRDVTHAWPGRAIVPDLADLLRVPGCERGALAALAALGDDAHGATAAIDALLGGAPDALRWRAAFALARVGGARAPSLRAARSDRVAAVRLWALRALPPGDATADEIAPWLADERPLVRGWAIVALARCGAAAAPFADRLAPLVLDPTTLVRACEACKTLGGHAAAAAPGLLRGLADEHLLPSALMALAAIGPAAAAAAADPLAQFVTQPVSADLVERPHRENDVLTAIDAFAQIDPARAVAVLWPGFLAELSSPWPGEWHLVARFAALKGVAAAKLPELRQMVAAGDRNDRLRALMALENVGPPAAAALAEVVPLLQADDQFVRAAARRTVLHVGPAAATALPQLDAAYGRQPNERTEFVAGIAKMGAAAEPLLLRALAADDEWTRRIASFQLSNLPSPSARALQALLDGKDTASLYDYARVRWPAMNTTSRSVPWLPGFGFGGLADLIETCRTAQGMQAAQSALLDEPHLQAWTIAFADHADTRLRSGAALVLGVLPPCKDALAVLRELAADPARDVRCAALLALGRPPVKSALPELAAAFDSDDWFVRATAAVALRRAWGN